MTITDTIHVAKVLAKLEIPDDYRKAVMLAFADDFERAFKRSKSFQRHEWIDKYNSLRNNVETLRKPIHQVTK